MPFSVEVWQYIIKPWQIKAINYLLSLGYEWLQLSTQTGMAFTQRIGRKRILFETQDIIRNLWFSKKGYACVCVRAPVSLFVCMTVCFYPSPLVHFLYFIMSSSSQIFCVRNKVHMWNFTSGCAKDTLDYMVRKYEFRVDGSLKTKEVPCQWSIFTLVSFL